MTDQYAYRAFGEEILASGTTVNPLRFQGRVGVRKESNGLDWMRARIYDSKTGQFSSPDPIGFHGGDVNLYRFARNNPVRWNDPLGLYSSGLCFWQAYNTFLSQGKSQIGACVAAKAACGSNIDCSSGSFIFNKSCPLPPPKPRSSLDCQDDCDAVFFEHFSGNKLSKSAKEALKECLKKAAKAPLNEIHERLLECLHEKLGAGSIDLASVRLRAETYAKCCFSECDKNPAFVPPGPCLDKVSSDDLPPGLEQ